MKLLVLYVCACQVFLNTNPQQRKSAPFQYTENVKQIFKNLTKSQKTSKCICEIKRRICEITKLNKV